MTLAMAISAGIALVMVTLFELTMKLNVAAATSLIRRVAMVGLVVVKTYY